MSGRVEIGYRGAFDRGLSFHDGIPSANLLKGIGGAVHFRAYVGGSYSVHLDWEVREAHNPFCAGGNWILSEVRVVGIAGAIDSLYDLEAFSTYREAVTAAKRLVRAAIAKAGK